MLYIEGVQHDFQEGRRPHIRLSHPLMHRDALPQCFLEKEQIRMPAFSSAFMGRNRGSWGLYSGGGLINKVMRCHLKLYPLNKEGE